jgi:hypothetical protein
MMFAIYVSLFSFQLLDLYINAYSLWVLSQLNVVRV